MYDGPVGSPLYEMEARQMSADLANPTAELVWSRALETFGDEAKARHWMHNPRDIFEDRSPQELVDTRDPAEQRRVLTVLIRIDYGVFS
jgi:putative toxin-antitoxin system antitoxin component (TIGR02293 family)